MTDPRNNGDYWVGVVADPEIKDFSNGRLISFRFALDRAMKDAEDSTNTTAWIDGVLFENDDRETKFWFEQVETGKLKKGSQLAVNAAFKMRAFKTKDDVRVEKPVFEINGIAYQRTGTGGEKKEADAGNKPESVIAKF